MLGRIVSALAGQQLARTVGGAAAGPLGAVVGLALPMVARRLGPVGMVGMAAAAWAVSRMATRSKTGTPTSTPAPMPGAPGVPGVTGVPARPTAMVVPD